MQGIASMSAHQINPGNYSNTMTIAAISPKIRAKSVTCYPSLSIATRFYAATASAAITAHSKPARFSSTFHKKKIPKK